MPRYRLSAAGKALRVGVGSNTPSPPQTGHSTGSPVSAGKVPALLQTGQGSSLNASLFI